MQKGFKGLEGSHFKTRFSPKLAKDKTETGQVFSSYAFCQGRDVYEYILTDRRNADRLSKMKEC